MPNINGNTSTATKNIFSSFDDFQKSDTLPKVFVEKMLETNERLARQSGSEHEREDNVCRLLASGMSVDEISLLLKIRADEIRIIESNNTKTKIPEYTRTYKQRVKSRARAEK
jgi:DNA-binding CsgD family transcriptional regulator